MHCKSLWIKASAKCINVNVNVNVYPWLYLHYIKGAVSDFWKMLLTFEITKINTPLPRRPHPYVDSSAPTVTTQATIDLSVSPAPLSYCCSLGQTNRVAHSLTVRAAVKTLSHHVFAQFWTQKATKWELNIPWRDL